jgi:hypothetical protein
VNARHPAATFRSCHAGYKIFQRATKNLAMIQSTMLSPALVPAQLVRAGAKSSSTDELHSQAFQQDPAVVEVAPMANTSGFHEHLRP